MSGRADKHTGYRRVREILDRRYGTGLRYRLTDPVDILIATVLSQATTDTNSSAAFDQLKRRFPTWDRLATAPPDEVADLVRPAGFGPTRGQRLVQIAQRLKDDFGCVTLDELRNWDSELLLDYLQSLPGVGPKTAACVALFGFGLPVVPVDTHVMRVASRLGLIPEGLDISTAQRILSDLVSERELDLHMQLIAHGRAVCRPTRPRCDGCDLAEECQWRPDGKTRSGPLSAGGGF